MLSSKLKRIKFGSASQTKIVPSNTTDDLIRSFSTLHISSENNRRNNLIFNDLSQKKFYGTYQTLIRRTDLPYQVNTSEVFEELASTKMVEVLQKCNIDPETLALFKTVFTQTEYIAEITNGDFINAKVQIENVNKETGQIILSKELCHANGKVVGFGHWVLQKCRYEINGTYLDSLTEHEFQQLNIHLNPHYSSASHAFVIPKLKAPQFILGYEIALSDEENVVPKSFTDKNGVIEQKNILKLLHKHDIHITSVIKNSRLIVYRPLTVGEKFNLYLNTREDTNFNKGHHLLIGTITNQEGEIIAIEERNVALPKLTSSLPRYANLIVNHLPEASNIRLTVNRNIATITIDQENASQNAITPLMLLEMNLAIDRIVSSHIRTIVFASAKRGNFIVGADVNHIYNKNKDQINEFALRAQMLFRAITIQPLFNSISVVDGYALGGGSELSITGFIAATIKALFSQPEVTIGVIPGFDACQRLAQRIGLIRAAYLIVSGHMIDANEALRIGLVDLIFSTKEELNDFIQKVNANMIAPRMQVLDPSEKVICETLDEMQKMATELFNSQHDKVNSYATDGIITTNETQDVLDLLNAQCAARLEAIKVFHAQMKTNDIYEKSDIERNHFVPLALSEGAQKAMSINLLHKKNYPHVDKVMKKLREEKLLHLRVPSYLAKQNSNYKVKNSLKI